MAKLIPIKCPSCNSDLEVNENDKYVTCEYCNTKILIDDEVKRIEVSIVGDHKKKIDMIKNHIKVGKNIEAYELIKELLKDNPYDIDALKLYIDFNEKKIDEYFDDDMKRIDGSDFDISTKNSLALKCENRINDVLEKLETIEKLNNNNKSYISKKRNIMNKHLTKVNSDIKEFSSLLEEQRKENESKNVTRSIIVLLLFFAGIFVIILLIMLVFKVELEDAVWILFFAICIIVSILMAITEGK